MKVLYVIFLLIFFHRPSISPTLVDKETNKIHIDDELEEVEEQEPSKYSDNLKIFEERLSLIKDPEYRLMGYILYQFFVYIMSKSDDYDNNDNKKNKLYHHIKPRKGVNSTIRRIREANDEKMFTNLYEYLTSPKTLNIAKSLIHHYFTQIINDESDSNLDESICNISWDIEKIQPPFELINSLPSCPCTYSNTYTYTKVKDQNNTMEHWWQEVRNPKDHLDKDKLPSSIHCLKIEVENNETLVSKYCCYDANYLLITRGSNIGNIHYMTKDLMKLIRKAFELYPGVKCNLLSLIKSMPAYNGNKCVKNPNLIKSKHQTWAKTIDINHEGGDTTKKR